MGSEEEIDLEEADDETFSRAKNQSQNGRGRQTSNSKEFPEKGIPHSFIEINEYVCKNLPCGTFVPQC